MEKRAQVTLFVIIAVLIAAGVIAVIFMQQKAGGEISPTPADVKPIQSYIENCLSETGKEAIMQTGLQAGFYTLPEPFLIYNYVEYIPYLYTDGKKKLLTSSIVENEISDYIGDEIKECLDNITSFKDFDVIQANYSVKTKISKDKIAMELNYPLTVKKGGFTFRFDTFDYNLKSNFNGAIEIANALLSEYEKNPGMFCLTCFDELMARHPFMKVAAVPATSPTIYKDKYIMFILEDEEYKIDDMNFVLRFIAEA